MSQKIVGSNDPCFAANEDEVTPPEAARVLYPRLQWVKVLVAGLLFWVPKKQMMN